jgi:hypothetical protein
MVFLVGALAARTWGRGLYHSSVERPGLTRAPSGEDRSPRHRVAQARLSRLAAGRARSLQYGGDPYADRGGREATQPRAGKSRRRAHSHHQPDQGSIGAVFLQTASVLITTADDDPRWRPPDWTWPLCRGLEWARRPGASPPMRMTASWFSSQRSPPDTSLWRDIRASMANSPRRSNANSRLSSNDKPDRLPEPPGKRDSHV